MKDMKILHFLADGTFFERLSKIALALLVGSTIDASAANLKVMTTGLGSGWVSSNKDILPHSILDGQTFIPGPLAEKSVLLDKDAVVLTARPRSDSEFVRWEGDASGTNASITVQMDRDRSVRAVFKLKKKITTITDFSPEKIRDEYLGKSENQHVNNAARFLAALPLEFKQNWILMTRSESLQTGTAKYPRLLLSSTDGTKVFTIGLAKHPSYPSSHPNAIEYMQWDEKQKNFRFHEIILQDKIGRMGQINRPIREISIDDPKCFQCHATNYVPKKYTFPNTILQGDFNKMKAKPNWDPYDSWGGMTPLNRDRIYQGSVEAAAFREIFNLWTWRNDQFVRSIIEQLELQPGDGGAWTIPGSQFDRPTLASSFGTESGTFFPGLLNPQPSTTAYLNSLYLYPSKKIPLKDRIQRVVGGKHDGHIMFPFDKGKIVTTEPMPVGKRTGTEPDNTDITYFNPKKKTNIKRGGEFVTLHHASELSSSGNQIITDEGRGVHLFDLLGGFNPNQNHLNQKRIADEVKYHRVATGGVPIDVRAITLAISKGWIKRDGTTIKTSQGVNLKDLGVDLDFFDARNGFKNGTNSKLKNIEDLYNDTKRRTESLPRRKAEIQRHNLDRSFDPYLYPNASNGLIAEYEDKTQLGLRIKKGRTKEQREARTLDMIRQEIFRRNDPSSGSFDRVTGKFVDREDYGNTEKVTLFRYFLEPLGVSVDKWSLGVRGRSRTYAFADVFRTYTDEFDRTLGSATGDSRKNLPKKEEDLLKLVGAELSNKKLPDDDAIPRYGDVQKIFNRNCIECHGGLRYPPYSFGSLDLTDGNSYRSIQGALNAKNTILGAGQLYGRITKGTEKECIPGGGIMPCGGPKVSWVDVETLGRWIRGGSTLVIGNGRIKTMTGNTYSFRDAGEFVLLRGEGLEMQVRFSTVQNANKIDEAGDESVIATVNALALQIGEQRITYQPGLANNPDAQLQLRLDGEVVDLTDRPIHLHAGGRILPAGIPGGMVIETGADSTIVVIPQWWDEAGKWIMHLNTRNMRGVEGLMGLVVPGHWLPALPGGALMGAEPDDLHQRQVELYQIFGDAWRVKENNSLFDYAEGISTQTFTPKDHHVGPALAISELVASDVQQVTTDIEDEVSRQHAIQDILETGNLQLADMYIAAAEILGNGYPSTPTLVAPLENYEEEVELPVTFSWKLSDDPENDEVRYFLYVWPIDERPDNNKAIACPVPEVDPGEAAPTSLSHTLSDLKPGGEYFWRVLAEDARGARLESETRYFRVRE